MRFLGGGQGINKILKKEKNQLDLFLTSHASFLSLWTEPLHRDTRKNKESLGKLGQFSEQKKMLDYLGKPSKSNKQQMLV